MMIPGERLPQLKRSKYKYALHRVAYLSLCFLLSVTRLSVGVGNSKTLHVVRHTPTITGPDTSKVTCYIQYGPALGTDTHKLYP
jgi:hypothetical protein